MASFNYWDQEQKLQTSLSFQGLRASAFKEQFGHRYNAEIAGFNQWIEFLNELLGSADPQKAFTEFLNALGKVNNPTRNACPRIFVSHRQLDKEEAVRIAYLANQAGFEYWLDVFDPLLDILNRIAFKLPPSQQSMLIAAIIEIALLNCSHVLAVITKNSIGSLWIPYEYGRVKEKLVISTQIACWLHPDFKARPDAEYLELGRIHLNENAISAWLNTQLETFTGCPDGAGESWQYPVPAALPS